MKSWFIKSILFSLLVITLTVGMFFTIRHFAFYSSTDKTEDVSNNFTAYTQSQIKGNSPILGNNIPGLPGENIPGRHKVNIGVYDLYLPSEWSEKITKVNNKTNSALKIKDDKNNLLAICNYTGFSSDRIRNLWETMITDMSNFKDQNLIDQVNFGYFIPVQAHSFDSEISIITFADIQYEGGLLCKIYFQKNKFEHFKNIIEFGGN